MTSGIDYSELYGQAQQAYLQADYQEAVQIIDRMAEEFPKDPHVLLLRGHIYLGLQEADRAQENYELVLQLTEQSDLIDYANKGLEQARSLHFSSASNGLEIAEPEFEPTYQISIPSDLPRWQEDGESSGWHSDFEVDGMEWDSGALSYDDSGEPTIGQAQPIENPFGGDSETPSALDNLSETNSYENPFASQPEPEAGDWQATPQRNEGDFPFFGDNAHPMANEYEVEEFGEIGEATFMVSPTPENNQLDSLSADDGEANFPELEPMGDRADNNLFSEDLELPNAQSEEEGEDTQLRPGEPFLEDVSTFDRDELENISNLSLSGVTQQLPDSDIFSVSNDDLSGNLELEIEAAQTGNPSQGISLANWGNSNEDSDFQSANLSGKLGKPKVDVQQGKLAPLVNAPLLKKQWITAAATGIISALAVVSIGSSSAFLATRDTPDGSVASSNRQPLWLALVAGAASFGTTLVLGQIATHHIKRSLANLQEQFDAIYAGNFNVKATVYSKDEIGQLAAKFNQTARVILTTTSDAQRRANEMEQAKEDLQRQVIRLLDDVEGSARGDLTVKAEVTADVLGAVADAFNLTIQNLREIVRQVKKAAQQVNKGSTDSESFARNQSKDALRMAEELAVTLNSVQMMTESIQRVAENAREAEEVARSSSVTALKGGESVERTVAGILQIRETVSDTARKVKRLAEASQEISKIVALISQIASRTNLLALNASIQAAKAGEAGRGFAIVADEVRQLADRSAKSLKEIEQIVLQIQSETGSVMTAMEEGIQQVIDVTEKSEQAKKSLEDIIEVSNHIDKLVRSITADTVKQRENSRSVAQVMQAVELTAQETSQESQRVAGSLQNLVAISRDLLTSVERFRIESEEGESA